MIVSVPLQIQPQIPPIGGLASVAAPLPLTEPEWRTGVQLTSLCGLEPFVWGCSSSDDKPVYATGDTVEFQSTTIGVEVACGPNGPNSPIGDIARKSAVEGLKRSEWQRLAIVLSDGVVGGGSVGSFGSNPSFQSEAVLAPNLDVTDPRGLVATVTDVLGVLCECYQSDTVLHVPAKFLPYFLAETLVEFDVSSGTYKLGVFDVSFDCYLNLGTPAAEILQPTATDGSEVWVYASTRPMIAMDRVVTVGSTQVQQNEYLYEASRGAIAVFDPCCLFASKALLTI